MKYYAKVISLNSDIEEEVVLSFGGDVIYCFVNSCAYNLHEGEIYPIDMVLTFLDDERIEPSNDECLSVKRNGNGFSYSINGLMMNGVVYADGIAFEHESFSDFEYLNKSCVKVVPDRITVSFL